MTDIIKEVEQLLDNMREPGFILTRKLVNEAKRLKVESENSEKIEHFATKTIERQSAEIEKKDIEIDILIRKKEALKDEVSELRAEVERLQEENKNHKSVIEAIEDTINPLPFETDFDKAIKTAKSEAIKEFAERLKEKAPNITEERFHILRNEIDNLVKEMVGDDNA